jgi:hypothetical protein
MKKVLFVTAALLMGVAVLAQRSSVISTAKANLRVPAPIAITDPVMPTQSVNTTVSTKSTLDELLGGSIYDMQTNGAIQNRLFMYPNGTIGATWTRGILSTASYSDRGTAYNYYDGGWGAPPTTRIETLRTGWPAYTPWGANGEMVISHQSATAPLVMNTRPTRGSGSWTQTILTTPAGASGLLWHRTLTKGVDNMEVHMIALTSPVANGGVVYNGLDGALLYYRSMDGGATWDISAYQFPQLTSSDYLALGGDDEAWGTPHGDTIYFAVTGNWTDTFIMASYDNGVSWNKIDILSNGNKMVATGTETGIFACGDGSIACELDNHGVFHVLFGRMRAQGQTDGKKYFPYTDGLIYWNSTMPMLQDSLILDTLDAHGQLLGYVYANSNPNDTIVAIPYYGVSMVSFPQITIAPSGEMIAMWSGITVGNISPDGYNYRHLWVRRSFDNGATWTDPEDLNAGLEYIYKEFAYPHMAKQVDNTYYHFIFQTADQPGSSIKDTTIPTHDVTIEYRKEAMIGVGVNDPKPFTSPVSQNVPNPVKDRTTITVKLEKASTVSLSVTNMTGQTVIALNSGTLDAGSHNLTVDASQLAPGAYFYTVKVNGTSYTHKMIVE